MKRVFLFLTACACAFGQGQAINQTSGPPPFDWVTLLYYNGSNQIIYSCYAPAIVTPTTFYVSSGTLTNVVVASNVGTANFSATAQFWIGQRVTVAGSTTVALNAQYRVATVSGTTITFTTSGVSDGTYATGALTLSTNGPLLNAALWSIQALTYASGNVSTVFWAGTPGITVPQNVACSNRANY